MNHNQCVHRSRLGHAQINTPLATQILHAEADREEALSIRGLDETLVVTRGAAAKPNAAIHSGITTESPQNGRSLGVVVSGDIESVYDLTTFSSYQACSNEV